MSWRDITDDIWQRLRSLERRVVTLEDATRQIYCHHCPCRPSLLCPLPNDLTGTINKGCCLCGKYLAVPLEKK